MSDSDAYICLHNAAVAAGVDSYIVKPFTAEAIETKLKQVYAKKHAA